MKVLIAAADRDLLKSYQKLWELEGNEVTTAFDGLQVMACFRDHTFDLVILDETLPRVGVERLAKLIRDCGAGLLRLRGREEGFSGKTESLPGETILRYPFLPGELFEKAEALMEQIRKEGGEENHEEG